MNSIPARSETVATPRLLDQVRGKIRLKHYSLRTEQTYVDWIKRFIRHFDKRHPCELGAAEALAVTPLQLFKQGSSLQTGFGFKWRHQFLLPSARQRVGAGAPVSRPSL